MRNSKLINIISLIGIICFIVYIIYDKAYGKQKIVLNKINYEINGVVDSIYTDKGNRGYTTLIFKNGKIAQFGMYELKRYQKGDSIVKKKGSDSLFVFRKGIKTGYKF